MNTLILHGDLIKISSKSGLGLFNIGNLGLERVNIFLSLNNFGLKFGSSTFKLLNSGHAFSFISRSPELDLSLGLGESLESIRLAHVLILNLLLQVLKLSGHVLVLGEKGSSVLGLSIGKSFGILQLGGERTLVLVGSSHRVLSLLNLSVKVLVLTLQTLLGRFSLIQGSGHFIKPGVGINNGSLEKLALSSSALPLTASSRVHLASARSRSSPALSFSALTLFPFRLSICSPSSDMVLLCFCLRAAKVPS